MDNLYAMSLFSGHFIIFTGYLYGIVPVIARVIPVVFAHPGRVAMIHLHVDREVPAAVTNGIRSIPGIFTAMSARIPRELIRYWRRIPVLVQVYLSNPIIPVRYLSGPFHFTGGFAPPREN
jgi:hypothetical protein